LTRKQAKCLAPDTASRRRLLISSAFTKNSRAKNSGAKKFRDGDRYGNPLLWDLVLAPCSCCCNSWCLVARINVAEVSTALRIVLQLEGIKANSERFVQ
jgi:hypothetical protein